MQSLAFETRRLRLRGIRESDAAAIERLAGARDVADTMISLPHPYPKGEAERYVHAKQAEDQSGQAVTFAIEEKEDGRFCGIIEVRQIDREHLLGELSFWLAVDLWGQGYMTEAVRAVVPFAFNELGLNRLYAYHMLRNPASGRVLEKNGFRQEGVLRQRVRKWERFEDVAIWALLRQDWLEGDDGSMQHRAEFPR